MNIEEDGVYHKCGEIFLADSDTYKFLCCYCNELFSEFRIFKTHSLIHLNTIESESEEIQVNLTNSDMENIQSLAIDKMIMNKDESNQDVLDSNNDSNDEHKFIFIETSYNTESYKTKEIQMLENNENKLTDEETFCPHCKIFFKNKLHDIANCLRVKQTITLHNGDFIKLLRKGILCCSSCLKNFENYKDLYEHHIKANHCYITEKCKICKFYNFINLKISCAKNNSKILDKEQKDVVNQEISKNCFDCSISFESKEDFDVHFETHHKDEEEDVYGGFFEGPDIDLNKLDRKYKCSFCERDFKTKSQKKIHMRIHTNDRPYKCNKCPSAFTVKVNLRNHIIYKHTVDRPFVCKYEGCEAKFKLYDMKRQHEKRHLPANFQCEKCGNSYKTKFSLLKHQQSRHVDSQNWQHQCDICQKRFAQPEYLVDHKRTHTGEKPFECDICSKFFRKRSSLREHKKLHSDERKYICRFCGKGFKQVAGYWGHMKRHPVMN